VANGKVVGTSCSTEDIDDDDDDDDNVDDIDAA
jgi:hypothetical protein